MVPPMSNRVKHFSLSILLNGYHGNDDRYKSLTSVFAMHSQVL